MNGIENESGLMSKVLFAKAVCRAASRAGLTSGPMAVLWVLVEESWPRKAGWTCSVGRSTLAIRTNSSEGMVKRHIRELASAGFLSRRAGHGLNKSVYLLALPKGGVTGDPSLSNECSDAPEHDLEGDSVLLGEGASAPGEGAPVTPGRERQRPRGGSARDPGEGAPVTPGRERQRPQGGSAGDPPSSELTELPPPPPADAELGGGGGGGASPIEWDPARSESSGGAEESGQGRRRTLTSEEATRMRRMMGRPEWLPKRSDGKPQSWLDYTQARRLAEMAHVTDDVIDWALDLVRGKPDLAAPGRFFESRVEQPDPDAVEYFVGQRDDAKRARATAQALAVPHTERDVPPAMTSPKFLAWLSTRPKRAQGDQP